MFNHQPSCRSLSGRPWPTLVPIYHLMERVKVSLTLGLGLGLALALTAALTLTLTLIPNPDPNPNPNPNPNPFIYRGLLLLLSNTDLLSY